MDVASKTRRAELMPARPAETRVPRCSRMTRAPLRRTSVAQQASFDTQRS